MTSPALSAESLFNVKDKVVLVTGAGTGIGKMLAAGYVQNGAKVYIASRKKQVIDETAAEINAMGPGQCIPLVADLITKAACDQLAGEIKKRESKLHILINNAGVSWGAPMDDFPEKQGWDNLFALNVKSIFYLTVACLPLLEAAANGNVDPARVINVSSVGGTTVGGGDNPLVDTSKGNVIISYPASKAAANHLTRVLAAHLAKHYITVNCIAPGIFPSRMTAFGFRTAGDKMVANQIMGRAGETTDMAGLGLFLGSRASAHITGAVIPLDGGTSLGTSSYARL
ncbi:NAD(P)-binding protein [Gonapodya prolifera JEL478]|uniref:NAD(P)-binding protein n=1 Tax=Gonapodya prolifera (strain JEL478) TaxID=1344416 RepID=A0A139A0M0_GONPJ|nr:NAD(P)-binding protein [Gonapodya prolifera JEL478]|eukprot:KXS10326.1 NAD(P)-binding protein [Gonapodya prolifera JEL478]